MAISDKISEVKNSLKDIKRKYRFKKARMLREDAAALQATMAKCRGQLEICRNDFNRAINSQSRNIAEGTRTGKDTAIQEQILWDAAIGYLLVQDAIFALDTISSYDSVSHAYDMLDAAMKQVAGKKREFPAGMKIGGTKERNAYGYITSSAALKAKAELLDSFFEDLKQNGNIEACLANARVPGDRQAELRRAYSGENGGSTEQVPDLDAYMNRLNSVPDKQAAEEEFDKDLDAMQSIHPPKETES